MEFRFATLAKLDGRTVVMVCWGEWLSVVRYFGESREFTVETAALSQF